MSVFVDFRAVKEAVSMQMALDHFGVNWLRKKGEELRGRCPVHKGEGTDTFHANLSKNAFQCFSCKARGNVLDFVAAMEKCSVRDAALKLAEWFPVTKEEPKRTVAVRSPEAKSGGEESVQNEPLKFQLKGVDPNHEYIASRKISAAVAEQFGIGFYSGKGSMSGRVVIPVHNERGELVAYSGRVIDGGEPKYKFPPGFHKSLVLYNLHRAVQDNEPRLVVVVEGFFDCLKVYEAGYPCVALMGCSLSEKQEELLIENFRAAIVLMDGNEAGSAAASEIAGRLSRKIFVRVIGMAGGQQPDMLTAEELQNLLRP